MKALVECSKIKALANAKVARQETTFTINYGNFNSLRRKFILFAKFV